MKQTTNYHRLQSFWLHRLAGSLHNVVYGIWCAIEKIDNDRVVRLIGGCRLRNSEIIDLAIKGHLWGRVDYSSNTFVPTFPDGLDVKIFENLYLDKRNFSMHDILELV